MILSNVLVLFGIFPTLKSQSKYLPNLPMVSTQRIKYCYVNIDLYKNNVSIIV